MKDNHKKRFWIVSFVTIASLLVWVAVSIKRGTVGFPLDDGWIHQTYARSLARGAGWTYSSGQPSAGATAPFWVLLLVPGYWLGASPVCWVLFLGLLLLWGMSLLSQRIWPLLSKHGGWWTWGAGLVIGLEWHLLWAALSGMETLLMSGWVLAVLAVLLYLEEAANQAYGKPDLNSQEQISAKDGWLNHPLWPWIGVGAFVGLGIWIRPEAVTLLGPVVFVALLSPSRKVSDKLRRTGLALAGTLGLFVPYLVFNRWLAGTWWPNTFFAKQAEYAVLRETPLFARLINQPVPLLIGVGAVLVPGFLAYLFSSIRGRHWARTAGALWVLGFITLYALRLPVTYQHGRYIIPAVPVLVLWGLAGTAGPFSGKTPGRLKWLASRLMAAMIATLLVLFWWLGLDAFTKDVAVINGEMVATAGWIMENSQEDDLIAAHDIGAIGYFTEREIIDLAGLISPDVIPFIRDESKLADYLDQKCPVYLVTFPDWYPEMVEGRAMVFQTDAAVTREFGKENMAVYLWGECSRE